MSLLTNSLPGWHDLLDIGVVTVFLYYFLLLIRGTRAVQILQGLVVLLVLQALFYQLKLQAAYFVLRGAVLSIVVALPIVFQPELRRALMQLGARSLVSPFTPSPITRNLMVRIIDEIAWAASVLSQTRTGALIVVERETGLEEYIETGVKVNGEVSSKLLLSIFIPRSPLHDGAAIVRGDKVLAASCYLPLSETPPTIKDRVYGTRHRAAIGITEQTDAIVVVVSEETGTVSLVKDGKLTSNIDEDTLKRSLVAYCAPTSKDTSSGSTSKYLEYLRRWLRFRERTLRTVAAAAAAAAASASAAASTGNAERGTEPAAEAVPSAPPTSTEVPPPTEAEARGDAQPEESVAERQRLHEEAVLKRALEAQRRKQEEAEFEVARQRAEETPSADEDGLPLASPAADLETAELWLPSQGLSPRSDSTSSERRA